MFPLQGAQMLQMLEKALVKSLPESLKVYGTVFHINHGNPFKLKAIVDKWPDFNTVVIRPQEQAMTDDCDQYTNTYQIYSKDPQNCQEFLDSPGVINWRQHLQIQKRMAAHCIPAHLPGHSRCHDYKCALYDSVSMYDSIEVTHALDICKNKDRTQSSLNEVIQNFASIKSFKIRYSNNLLYMTSETVNKLIPSLLDTKNLPPTGGKPKAINQDMFKLSSLDATHAAMVNQFWSFGGNEKSQKFIEQCIRSFPSSCVLGPEGTPVSWTLMDQTGEIRMGGTLLEYRAQGLVSYVVYSQVQTLNKLGFPSYSHTDRKNKAMQKMSDALHHILMPSHWNQWVCSPL